MIDELASEPFDDLCLGLDLGEQQATIIRADHASVKFAHDRTPTQGVKFQLLWLALCHCKATLYVFQ